MVYKKMTGDRNFEHYIRSGPDKQSKHSGHLSKNIEEFDPTSKKPEGAKSFGMIPNKIVNKLLDKSNSNVRGEASEMLQIEMERCVKIQDIIPFLKSFLGFLSGLVEDINSRVVINILETVLILQKRLPTKMSGQLNLLIKMLLKINSEAKKEIKMLIYQNVKQLMSNCPVRAVVAELSQLASSDKAVVREEVLCLLSLGLLTFPSSDLDLDTISQTAAEALLDRARRVRQAALECLALVAQCLGHHRRQLHHLTDLVADLDRRERAGGQIVGAVRARLGRRCLPRLSSDGLLEYGLAGPGPDLEWILAGQGPLSLSSPLTRRSRADSSGAVRTASLPPLGSRLGSGGKMRSRSLYDHSKTVIPSIVKHSAPPPPQGEDREQPCDLQQLLASSPSPAPEAYQTFSRSESLVDLRDLAPADKPEAQKFDVKKSSLVSLGLASLDHQTIFDSENNADDDKLPGAFKNPSAALGKAIKDLESEEWQVEVAGLGALVRYFL